LKYERSIIAIYIAILSYLAFKQYTIAFVGFLVLLFVLFVSFFLSFVFRGVSPLSHHWVAQGRRGKHPHRRRADGDGEVNTLSPAGQVIAPLLYKGAGETNSSFFPPTLHHLRPSQTSPSTTSKHHRHQPSLTNPTILKQICKNKSSLRTSKSSLKQWPFPQRLWVWL
jgi:hypothetical protein